MEFTPPAPHHTHSVLLTAATASLLRSGSEFIIPLLGTHSDSPASPPRTPPLLLVSWTSRGVHRAHSYLGALALGFSLPGMFSLETTWLTPPPHTYLVPAPTSSLGPEGLTYQSSLYCTLLHSLPQQFCVPCPGLFLSTDHKLTHHINLVTEVVTFAVHSPASQKLKFHEGKAPSGFYSFPYLRGLERGWTHSGCSTNVC